MTQNDTFQDIQSITLKLIEIGLSVQQNFPYRAGSEIACKEGVDLSPVLRNISYEEKYNLLNAEQNYNIKFLDGAITQMMYSFNNTGRTLESHRLVYFPAPTMQNYEDDPEAHERDYFGRSEFHDFLENNVVKSPLRFDYNRNIELYTEIHHPFAHLHMGEYESCRIPTSGPLTPSQFINFILRNFYNSALLDYCDNYSFPTEIKFSPTIASGEKNILHFNIS